MTNLVRQAEDDAALAVRSTTIIGLGHRLVELAFAAESGCQGYAFTRNPLYVDMYRKAIGDFPAVLREFHERPQSSSEQKQAQEQIENLTKRYLGILAHDMTPEGIQQEEKSLSAEVLSMLQNRIEDFLGEESDIQESRFAAQSAARQFLNHFVFFAVGCNVLMAVLLSLFFSANITKRLRVMIDNASLLAAGKALHEPVGGQDEITQLDSVFHEMAESLRRVEQAKRDFVAMVSHDLKVPLNAVQLFLQALTGGLFGEIPERMRTRAHGAEENISRSMKMIKDLLDFEKLDSGMVQLNLSERNLNDLISEIVTSLAPLAAEHQIEIVFEKKGDIKALIDADRISQVLMNLLSNAIKFSPRDSSVTVSCDVQSDFARVAITDKGRGIPEELQKEIFEAFKQAHTKDTKDIEGSGLGLAICKKLLEIHGGQIGVDSKIGEGSSFWFLVPLKPSAKASPVQQSPKQQLLSLFLTSLILCSLSSCKKGNENFPAQMPQQHELKLAEAHIAKARQELVSQDFEEALKSANEAIKNAPANSMAYLLRGYASYKMNDLQTSISDFDKAIVLRPTDYQGYEYRAAAYQTLKRFRKAVSDYSRALALIKTGTAAESKLNKELGTCYLSYGALDDAKRSLSKAIISNPSDASLYALRATAELHLSEKDECLKDANCSLTLDSRNAQAYQVRSRLMSLCKQSEAANKDEKMARELFAQQLNYEELNQHEH